MNLHQLTTLHARCGLLPRAQRVHSDAGNTEFSAAVEVASFPAIDCPV